MSNRSQRTTNELEQLRLPELQRRFHEVVGETTRSPNRTFLIRRIEESLAARAVQDEEAPASNGHIAEPREAEPAAEPQEPVLGLVEGGTAEPREDELVVEPQERQETSREVEPLAASAPASRQRGRFASMTIEELQAKYLEAVGRATSSDDRRYLIWKVREAEKGRIPVGPRQSRKREGEPIDMKVLPLRLESEVVERMDEAWRSRGIKNRMEFFRRALGHYLTHLGADEVAALLTAEA